MPEIETKNINQVMTELDILEYRLTHVGNAHRFAKMYKDQIKYYPLNDKWYIWNDVVWKIDTTNKINTMLETQNTMFGYQADSLENKKITEKIKKWVSSCESNSNMLATLTRAKTIQSHVIVDGWDNSPYLFACQNGVVNLKTGELEKGNPDDLITLQSPLIYDKKAECPLWEKFMYEAFDEDLEVIHYVKKALGYSMTGNNKEQVVFIGHGTGSNGKSTMLRILLKILGDYGHTAPRQTFQLNHFNDQTNDIAQFPGKRFVSWSETKVNSYLDEEKIKAMTGGENQRARFLNHEFFEFQPILKLWMFFNHKPTARDDSQGFWRRMRVIPFNHIFDGRDKEIDVKLSKELPGILNWLIEGCIMWQNEGLEPLPDVIKEATGEYQIESDPLNQWLLSCISVDDQKSEKASELYKSYWNWAKGEGFSDKEILTNTMFGKRMTTKFKKIKSMEGAFYIGLSLLKTL